jgi:hypothetical protein
MSGAPSSLIRVLYRVAILLWLCMTTLRFANMLPQPPSTHSRIILKASPVAPPTVSLPPPPPTTQSSIGNGLAVISPHKCQRKNYTRSTAPQRRSEVRRKSQGTSQTEIDPDHSLEERDMDNCSMEACFGTEGDPDFLESMVGGESGTNYAIGYEDYIEHFESGSIGVLRLEKDLYVVQGWDAKKRQAKVRTHLYDSLSH